MKKKAYLVMARTQGRALNGFETGKGHRKFKKRSGLYVSDPVEAAEIEQRYGKKGDHSLTVVEDDRAEWHLNSDRSTDGHNTLHHYTFGQMGVDLPPREKIVGKKKKINGTMYIFLKKDGKLILTSIDKV